MQQLETTARPRRSKLAVAVARLLVAVVAILGVTLATSAPANAHVVTWDWNDNHALCKYSSCVRSGNLVRMWQQMLWVENLYSDIDGAFGPNTHNATVAWQQRYNSRYDPNILTDGGVGPQTWSAAQRSGLYHWYDDGPYEYYSYMGYTTPARAFNMRKHMTTGVWEFEHYSINGVWYNTSHG